jgi:hypothetical protein
MEDRGDHRVRRAVALTFALLLSVRVAQAQEHDTDPFEPWPSTVSVETNPDSVIVESEVHGTLPGGSGSQASGSGASCHPEPIGHIGESLYEEFWSRPPNEFPFMVWCDGEAVGLVWLTVGGGGPPPVAALSPEQVAMRLRETIPMPNVTIEANPERGLVGVESWFWIEGYNGESIVESTDAFGRRVEVEARVEHYEWSFGDGKAIRSESPGRPYPQRSDVRHVYERSSLGYPKGYTVEAGFFFSVRYRVGGGGWIDLPGIERMAQTQYPVRESQAVIRQ